jgi:hypothetical protein
VSSSSNGMLFHGLVCFVRLSHLHELIHALFTLNILFHSYFCIYFPFCCVFCLFAIFDLFQICGNDFKKASFLLLIWFYYYMVRERAYIVLISFLIQRDFLCVLIHGWICELVCAQKITLFSLFGGSFHRYKYMFYMHLLLFIISCKRHVKILNHSWDT